MNLIAVSQNPTHYQNRIPHLDGFVKDNRNHDKDTGIEGQTCTLPDSVVVRTPESCFGPHTERFVRLFQRRMRAAQRHIEGGS
jgi:hypothetical protein